MGSIGHSLVAAAAAVVVVEVVDGSCRSHFEVVGPLEEGSTASLEAVFHLFLDNILG